MSNHRKIRASIPSEATVEREASRNWLAKALVCFKNYRATGHWKWLLRAENYGNEALEHGALVEDGGKTVARVEKVIKAERRKS